MRCPYARLGCQWAGQYNKLSSHESVCAHPHKTGAELMKPLQDLDEQRNEDVRLYKMMLDLMSYEKVVIAGECLLISLHRCELFGWQLSVNTLISNM